MSLMPDEQEQSSVHLYSSQQKARQPNLLTAVMSGLLLLLISRSFLHPGGELLFVPLVGAAVIYFLLISYRPTLPSTILAIVAAELGLLYCLPWMMIYHTKQLESGGMRVLIGSILFAGVTGVILGRILKVDRYPQYVIPLNFLTMFIFFSLLLQIGHP